ncbi:aldo-keto reductase family protein [Sphingomonas melonis]
MTIIDNENDLNQALRSELPAAVKSLLEERADLIDLATFIIPQPGDTVSVIEEAGRIGIATNMVDGSRYGEAEYMPSFEWAVDHGGAIEVPFILSDDGSGVVLLIPDVDGIDPTLLAIARHFATPA